MKLQKLLYYCQGWHLAWEGVPLFKEPIYAWANGPVVRAVYNNHRGKFNLAPPWSHGDAARLAVNEIESVDGVLEGFRDWTARQLVVATHDERPWREARRELPDGASSDAKIDLDTMADFFGGQ